MRIEIAPGSRGDAMQVVMQRNTYDEGGGEGHEAQAGKGGAVEWMRARK